jgi:HK97 family phage portal protein
VAQAPETTQLIQSRTFSNLEIALMFGVPAHMLQAQMGGPSITYQNVEQESIDFVKWGLLFWLTQVEEALTQHIPGVQYVRFNLDGLMRTSTLDRYRAHQIALEAGFLTVEEIRALEGREPLPPSELPQAPPAPTPQQQEVPPELQLVPAEGGQGG